MKKLNFKMGVVLCIGVGMGLLLAHNGIQKGYTYRALISAIRLSIILLYSPVANFYFMSVHFHCSPFIVRAEMLIPFASTLSFE